MRAYTDFHSYIFYSKQINIFLGFSLRDYLFITTTIIFVVFLAWLLNGKNECDDLPGGVTPPQASMKLSPPRHCCCSPPRRRHCPVRATGSAGAGTAGTADSPAQGG